MKRTGLSWLSKIMDGWCTFQATIGGVVVVVVAVVVLAGAASYAVLSVSSCSRAGSDSSNAAGNDTVPGKYAIHELDALFHDVAPGVVCIKVLKGPHDRPVPLGGADGGGGGEVIAGGGKHEDEGPVLREPGGELQEAGLELRLGTGSGVVLDESGLILTAHHVVKGARSLKVIFGDDDEVPASVVGVDELTDLALLKIHSLPVARLQPLSLRSDASASLRVGEWIVAVGGGNGVARIMSKGVVAGMDSGISGGAGNGVALRAPLIRTDAIIEPGNSGGPLIDLDGKVVGIVTAKVVRGGRVDGFGSSGCIGGGESGGCHDLGDGGDVMNGSSEFVAGFAFGVASDGAKMVSDQLARYGRVNRSVVGMSVRSLSLANGRKLGLDDGLVGKAMVMSVAHGKPAEVAGFMIGDVIRSVGGREVVSAEHLRWLVELAEPEASLHVKLFRNGALMGLDMVPVRREP